MNNVFSIQPIIIIHFLIHFFLILFDIDIDIEDSLRDFLPKTPVYSIKYWR